jgi:tRNA pseudouridine55 synthase
MTAIHSSDISGLIPINKPRGITSKDVSRILTRRFGKIKLGHVGTLDPDADGVLPVLVGRATKLQDYLLDLSKAYSFELTLGVATDTLDATGQVVAERPWAHVKRDDIEREIKGFLGEITQVPPLYSAIKFQGKELYKYAHAGREAEDLPLEHLRRRVYIFSLTIDYCDLPKIGMTVHCGKGTYVRTIGNDLAAALGTVGHITRLTRILSAGIELEKCVSIEQATAAQTTLESVVTPIDQLSIGLPTWSPDDMFLLQRLVDGQHVFLPVDQCPAIAGSDGQMEILAKSSDGRSVGIINVVSLGGDKVKLHMKRGL